MNRDDKLKELLKIYQRVSLLADKNGCRVLRLRHKKLEKDLVLHSLPKANPAYEYLAGIRAGNLPLVYEVFNLDDGVLVLEEYIDGLNLVEICDTGKISRRGARKILRGVLDGLCLLHENNIIHRDIKPENIMVDKNGRIVLIDFNSSRRVSIKSRDTELLGTVGYASPELGVKQSDQRTDIYAMGILLNVLLCGKHPSEKIVGGRMGKIVKKSTAISPDDRYQTAQEFKRALWRVYPEFCVNSEKCSKTDKNFVWAVAEISVVAIFAS